MLRRISAKAVLASIFATLFVGFQNCGEGFRVATSGLSSSLTLGSLQSSNDVQMLQGKTLFINNCSSCHNGPDSYSMGRSSKEDRTGAQISAAIMSNPSMSGIASLKALSGAQLDAIGQYLKTVPPPVNGVACRTDFAPVRTPMRVLSHSEYDNIAADVFLSKKKPSVEARFVLSAFGSSGFSNTSITSEPATPAITVETVEKFLTAATLVADELIANKAQAGSGYSRVAACAGNANPVAEACYDSIVRSLGQKIWRRPVSETAANNEFARLKLILKTGAFDLGLNGFVKALLMSPHFLTVNFSPNTVLPTGSVFNLNEYQLASRLSFFLWRSTPDDSLLAEANAGTLSVPNNLKNQIVRMLKDVKGRRFANLMTEEWLGANEILTLGLTTIDAATLSAMVSETLFMFEDIRLNDASLLNAVAANYSFLNKSLADYYGVPFAGTDPAQFYKTSLASTPRRGVVNHASILIASAGAPDQSHPVSRGKFVAQKFGCYDIAPPPATLDISLPTTIPPNSTPAEILVIHTQRAQCASCHNTLDPYGLALETYDARGIWRSNYLQIANRPIVVTGVLPSGEKFNSTPEYMDALATSPTVRSCMVRKIMAAGLARRVASVDDQCIAGQFSATGMTATSKFSDLVFSIVTSRQFKMQTAEAP